jgi:hypothetical protein
MISEGQMRRQFRMFTLSDLRYPASRCHSLNTTNFSSLTLCHRITSATVEAVLGSPE